MTKLAKQEGKDREEGMKILLAIDDSIFSEVATQVVIQQLRPEPTEVCILHAFQPLILSSMLESQVVVETLEANERKRQEDAQKLVARAEQLLRKAGFKVQTVVEKADPRAAIVDYAANWKADLIVLGSHGRKGLDRFLIGSVAEFVARHAFCSVQIVRIPGTAKA